MLEVQLAVRDLGRKMPCGLRSASEDEKQPMRTMFVLFFEREENEIDRGVDVS